MRFSKAQRTVVALLFTIGIGQSQPCMAQQQSPDLPQSDAEFTSYSEEVLASSRRQRMSVPTNVQTNALELSATDTSPKLLSPPSNRQASATATEFVEQSDFGGSLDTRHLLMKFVAGIVLSASVCFSLLFIGSRWLPQHGNSGGVAGSMQLVDTLHVGQRCYLQLVQVKDRLVIVGRDASGIQEIVPLSSSFESGLDEAEQQEAMEFENAAEALLAQKGVTEWKRAKLRA